MSAICSRPQVKLWRVNKIFALTFILHDDDLDQGARKLSLILQNSWLGTIVVLINCGLDHLWFRSDMKKGKFTLVVKEELFQSMDVEEPVFLGWYCCHGYWVIDVICATIYCSNLIIRYTHAHFLAPDDSINEISYRSISIEQEEGRVVHCSHGWG